MKNNLLILSILSSCILSSCTSTKQLHQSKTNITTETSTQETTVTNSQILSNTRITETHDTSILLSGFELTTTANFNSLFSGDTIFATGENLLLKTFYDSLSKTIKTQATSKPQTVSFKYQKITERQELKTGIVTSTKQEQQQQSIQTVNKDKEFTRQSLPWWFIVFIIVAVIGIIGWVVLKLKRFI
jgi:hypothetical protein